MARSSLDNHLDLLEAQFKEVGISLIQGSPESLQSHGSKLQQLAVGLIQMVDEVGRAQLDSPDRTKRIKALATGLAVLRENLLRRSSYVDGALELVVPTTGQKPTYAGSGAYGGPVHQSGAFRVFRA